eukprot:1156748-Pelagomonas_calceolata.AAC.12
MPPPGQPEAEHFDFKRFLLATRVYMDKGASTRSGAISNGAMAGAAGAGPSSSSGGKGDGSSQRPAKKQKQEGYKTAARVGAQVVSPMLHDWLVEGVGVGREIIEQLHVNSRVAIQRSLEGGTNKGSTAVEGRWQLVMGNLMGFMKQQLSFECEGSCILQDIQKEALRGSRQNSINRFSWEKCMFWGEAYPLQLVKAKS